MNNQVAHHREALRLDEATRGNFARTWPWVLEALWMMVEVLVLRNPLVPGSWPRVAILRVFGARVGAGVRIREGARVKYPWLLEIGERCWIGEQAWLYNQAQLTVGADTVISQGAFVSCGTHDTESMDLVVLPTQIGDRCWVAAFSIVLAGSRIGDGCVIGAGTVFPGGDLPPGTTLVGARARVLPAREGSKTGGDGR